MPRSICSRRILLSILWGLIACMHAGCKDSGPTRVEVTGTVTLDGTPVPDGVLEFFPEAATNGPTAGAPIKNGQYEIKQNGPIVGKYRVEIKATRKTGKKREAGTPAPPGTMIEEIEQYIPEKYNSKSRLKYDFQPGLNEAVFDLKSK